MDGWYGLRCPTFQELEAIAISKGVSVAFHPDFDVPRFFWDEAGEPWFIGIPEQFGPLARLWALAHELGHFQRHTAPPVCRRSHADQELQADEWASCALIPVCAVRKHPDAHGLVGFMRKNYQHFGGREDRVRALAYRIAFTRLRAESENVA